MTKKDLLTWEKEFGVIIQNVDQKKLSEKVTQDEFSALLSDVVYVGVNHEHRKEFLEANGYEVTRENMSNPDLSAKPKNPESE